jgi:hypothetical protein
MKIEEGKLHKKGHEEDVNNKEEKTKEEGIYKVASYHLHHLTMRNSVNLIKKIIKDIYN